MKILVTNDDGINADGLWTLVEELKWIGDITVIAPDREQSGVGTSISFHRPLRITRIHDKIPGIDTYSVEGTPADCVIMALKVVMTGGIDMVVSGINQGPNCGYDVFLSGTVGAAIQGFFYSIPSLAVSMYAYEKQIYQTGARVAREVASYIKEKGLPGKMLLNINVPNVPMDDVTGMEVTRLGEQIYTAGIETGNDGRHDYYWIQHRAVDIVDNQGTDLWAVKNGRVSVTPLRFSRNEHYAEFVIDMAHEVALRLFNKKTFSKKEA